MSAPPPESETILESRPWYREPWPWILMSGPAIVVVAGIATAAIAVISFDGLVADDYYKQGLGINRDIARDERARLLGVVASLQFNEDRSEVHVMVTPPAAAGGGLRLRVVHPTRPGEDQSVALVAVTPGDYEGQVARLREGSWRLTVEDTAGTWRVTGDWSSAADDAVLHAPPGGSPG